MPARFKAPTANGDVLAVPDFNAIPKLVDANRRLLDRSPAPVRDLRALVRRELDIPDGPLVLAGHQPELSHPGVWAKNFALAGLARKVGGTALNIVVDNDTLKHPSIRVPFVGTGPESVRLEAVPFDTQAAEVPYEDRRIENATVFHAFPDRVLGLSFNWGFTPLIAGGWPEAPARTPAAYFTAMRKDRERAWGCETREVAVSMLTQTESFRRFAGHILADLPRFRDVYNASIRAYRAANRVRSAVHPAPELEPDEIPFWVRKSDGRRTRNTGPFTLDQLRPRALTLTLFARLCVGDFFIHGIGGGKYDEVTDAIIRDYFGVDPPAFQVLSGTLHLPLPAFPSSLTDAKEALRTLRDMDWNPQRHMTPEEEARPEVRGWIDEKLRLAASEPPQSDRAARREWFRQMQTATFPLRFSDARLLPARKVFARRWKEAAANAMLQRRDFAWVLYPEETLRPFLQQFLTL